MKRVVGMVAVFLVLFAGIAAAAGTTKVTVNGKEIAFKTAPSFQNNVLMVPLEEVVAALGIEARWNVGSNTLEIVDKRGEQIAQLQKDLDQAKTQLAALQVGQARSAETAPKVTAGTLLDELNKRFATFGSGETQIKVTWTTFTSTDGVVSFGAMTDGRGDLAYLKLVLAGKDSDLKTWFTDAAKLIAQVYPTNSTAALIARDTFSSYPSGHWDDIQYNSGGKWIVTEFIVWAFNDKDGTRVLWDSKNY